MEIPSPVELKKQQPLSKSAFASIANFRSLASQILLGKNKALVAIVGPCSIHDPESALEYAERLKKLSIDLGGHLFLIMRVFVEKSRTHLGWKGMLYDPYLDGTNDLAAGLRKSRRLFIELAEMGVPTAMELFDPLTASYFDDLLSWGLIGARTSGSPYHRQMASGMPFPVGFKNDVHGGLDEAILGVATARSPHVYLGVNGEGKVAAIETEGNPFSHLVLRGALHETNFDPLSIAKALHVLEKEKTSSRILIDCSHGNSGKDPRRQSIALESILEQAHPMVAGFMLESHIHAGKQTLFKDLSLLDYGVSITDPCLSWEETEKLLQRSMSMSSVQN
ncbi:MAG: 3-deoxy-7-phosphoheptulonate synthase [Chlamydiae bacterium RIFCSPHIGHO2_12_FULL_49_9]|nr:MAG: 3-deoxy-7-phosphoheptulonate synthase [Chlamydiae bacterium RIFCSPHIGHO2_12_FULL_49_9]